MMDSDSSLAQDWRRQYGEDHLEVIDLYNRICAASGWWPVDRFSPELADALDVTVAGRSRDDVVTMLADAARERRRGDAVYNTPKGNKLIRILWSNY